MRELKKPIIIFSVFKGGNAENELNHLKTLAYLTANGTSHMEVDGVYKGQVEKSILVELNDYELESHLVRELAKLFNQESILTANEERIAYLEYMANGKKELLGKIVKVDSADGLISYTRTKHGIFTTIKEN